MTSGRPTRLWRTGAAIDGARQAGVMDVVQALDRLGGIASARELRRLTTRRRIRGGVRRGQIVRQSRGRYSLPTAPDALRSAAALTAVVCLRSAAAQHGWHLKTQPPEPELMVRRGR